MSTIELSQYEDLGVDELTHSPQKTQLNSSNSKVGIVHYEILRVKSLMM